MMHHKVLIVLAALFGIYGLFKTTKKLAKLIIVLQVVGIGITFLPIPGAFVPGILVFILSGAIACGYPFISNDADMSKKLLIIAIVLPVTVANTFIVCHFPLAGLLGYVMLLPIAVLLYTVIKKLHEFKNEIGFLVIFAADAFIKFLMSVEWTSFK